MPADHVGQVRRIQRLASDVIGMLAGRDREWVYDVDPARRLCIGVLSAVPDESESGSRRIRTPSQPTAMGFTLGVESAIGSASVDIELDVYYRTYPSLAEQLERSQAEDTGSAGGDKNTRWRQKYRKLHVSARGALTGSESDLDGTQVEAAINSALDAARDRAARDADAWCGTQGNTLPRSALSSEAALAGARAAGEPAIPKWQARIVCSIRTLAGNTVMTLQLENVSETGKSGEMFFFDVRITCTLEGSRFQSRPFHLAAEDFRYETVSWGRGSNCTVEVSPDRRMAASQTAPVHWQPRIASRTELDRSCRASSLSSVACLDDLEAIGHHLERYLDGWRGETAPANYESVWARDIATFAAEVDRFRLGLSALRVDPRLLRAFQLANLVAHAQFARAGYATWRLFQVAFIVTLLPSLLGRERSSEEPWRAEAQAIDVLWFPTGGGKTEAFFGLIVTAMFYDRLRGKTLGPTAWLRYPLRMLSVQQLQRLVNFVAEAEEVRKANADVNVGDPFLVGYFAGLRNSPNDLTRASGTSPIDKLALEAATSQGQRRLRLLQACPYCSSGSVIVSVSVTDSRLRHECGDCRRIAPLVFSDAEVYRYAPAVIVGTVDRLARIGQTEHFRQALGLVDYQCPDHGYSIARKCVEGRCTRKAREFVNIARHADATPTIMLQDELHLLKESLGTYDSHFETLLDLISEVTGAPLPSKRFAATATIEGFEQHVTQLYGPREARRFPSKGMTLWDSAYTTIDPVSSRGRLYVGILPLGRTAQDVTESAIRRLISVAVESWQLDVADRNNDYYDLVLGYANEKRVAAELGAALSPDTDIVVLTGDKPMDDVRGAIDRVASDRDVYIDDRLKAIIATSIISHGVDLSRLNQMIFAGFPGHAADYIQASSRVGREHVGIVFTLFRPKRLIELSAYGYFAEYHERLYQLVEPVPIARFSKGAFHRTLSAMYSAVLLNVVPCVAGGALAGRSFQRGADALNAYRSGELTDAVVIGLLRAAYGIDKFALAADVVASYDEVVATAARKFRNQLGQVDEWSLPSRLSPAVVPSLREVDEQVDIGVHRDAMQLLSRLER